MEELAIKLTGVSKKYRLGAIGGKTLQEDLQSWWAQKRGRENPNLKIGAKAPTNQAFWALREINLTVRRGERLGIIGANGAGKSTLLKLLSRVTAPTEGEIEIWGRVSSMLEVGTGFHREMTGRENIYMNGSILGMTRAEIDAQMDAIIDFAEMREFIDTPVKRYSSGMLVKLAFSVAAHLRSEIMIMDEVLAVGDMAFQKKCLERMRTAAENEQRTILYVSHNMQTIRMLCSRCIVLSHGTVVFDGEPEQAIAAYMTSSLDENAADMDLCSKERPVARTGLTMQHLRLLDKTIPSYRSEETLRLQLRLTAEQAVADAAVRLTLRTDADVGLATAWSAHFALQKGAQTLTLSMPLDTLAKGTFYASIGVWNFDEIGRPLPLDHISRAFRMEIVGDSAWSVSANGYLKLPEIAVL